MSEFLRARHADDATRERQIRRVVLIEGSVNLTVLAVKTLVGLSSGSLTILGDAVHSLTDVANNIIAWVVLRMSARPPDREHPYGHRKFETLAVFGVATLLTVLAFELALAALRREQTTIEETPLGLALMLGVLAINFGLAVWQRRRARSLRSELLRADASHTFADVLTTVVVIVGWQLSARGYPWLDTVCALGVSVLIFYLAFGLFRRAVPVLVDGVAVDPDALAAAVNAVDGVSQVRRLRSHWLGSARAVDMVIVVDPACSAAQAHAVADAVEAELERRFQVTDITVHVETSETAAR